MLDRLIQLFGQQDAVGFVTDVLRNPRANPQAAFVLLGIGVIIALILVLLVLIFVSSAPVQSTTVTTAAEPVRRRLASSPAARSAANKSGSAAVTALVVVMLAVVASLAMGVSTGTNSACLSCHQANPHAGYEATDPHVSVRCVQCHEAGGPIVSAALGGPARLSHLVSGATKGGADGYGLPISAGACRRCHVDDIAGVKVDELRGIRVSHKEPLAAGAQCIDCHVPKSGVISVRTAGMDACLRCHDQKTASAACSACHIGDPAKAIRAHESTGTPYARQQIQDVRCGGCHNEKKQCDTCHGIRMPHTAAFKAVGHARVAAEELWSKNGKMSCTKCHYATSRPCTQCHANSTFPSHALTFRVDHQGSSPRSCICHQRTAQVPNRNFCAVCHANQPPLLEPQPLYPPTSTVPATSAKP